MWRDRVKSVCPEARFEPPASREVIAEVEAALGVAVPVDLRALWLETNGILDRYGDGIWSAEPTIRDNMELRSFPEQNDLIHVIRLALLLC